MVNGQWQKGVIMTSINIEGNGANQEYQIKKTPVDGSCDEDGGKGGQKSTERLHRREKTSWKARGKWLDDMDRDAKRMLECRNWRKSAEDRDAWRQRIEGAKDQVWLQCRRRIRRRRRKS